MEKEVSFLRMWILARRGLVTEFQIFVKEGGGKKQVYQTKAQWRGARYVCYHDRPFPFMLTNRRKILTEKMANKLLI